MLRGYLSLGPALAVFAAGECRAFEVPTFSPPELVGRSADVFSPEPHALRHSFKAGFELGQIDYHEIVPQPAKSTESGLLPRFLFGYRLDPQARDARWSARLNVDVSFASTHY